MMISSVTISSSRGICVQVLYTQQSVGLPEGRLISDVKKNKNSSHFLGVTVLTPAVCLLGWEMALASRVFGE